MHSVGFEPTRFTTPGLKSGSLDHSDKNAYYYILIVFILFLRLIYIWLVSYISLTHINKTSILQVNIILFVIIYTSYVHHFIIHIH